MQLLDKSLLALGVRQPWAELILRGVKTVEVRTVDTGVNRTIYLYASKKLAEGAAAGDAALKHGLDVADLPTGKIVGLVDIVDCRDCIADDVAAAHIPEELLAGRKAWVLANPRRLEEPVKPRYLPYGIWFYPFERRNGAEDAGERRGGHGRG